MPKVIPEYREEAKKKIIQAGLEVMSRKGYYATTLEDIASHIGVSKGALYIYFKNKDDLVGEIIRLVHEDLHDTAIKFSSGTNPYEIYRGFLEGFLGRSREQVAFIHEVRAVSLRKPEINQIFSDLANEAIQKMTHCFEVQQAQGNIRTDCEPRTLAFAMFNILGGLGSSIMRGMDPNEIRCQFETICSTLFEMKITGDA